jgi:hypothetical protein
VLLAAWLVATGEAADAWHAGMSAVQVQRLGASTVLAVLYNVSAYACLGAATAAMYSVCGHLKTCLVIAGGWVLFDGAPHPVEGTGALLAATAIAVYSASEPSQQQNQARPPPPKSKKKN